MAIGKMTWVDMPFTLTLHPCLSIYLFVCTHFYTHPSISWVSIDISELPSSPEKNKYKNNSSYPKSENSNKNNDGDVKV